MTRSHPVPWGVAALVPSGLTALVPWGVAALVPWRLAALAVALASSALAAPAAAQEEIAPLHSATVSSKLRTLRGLPLKRLIDSPAAWRRVTFALADAPPAPAFAQGEVCVLVVVDESGGARSRLERIERAASGGVRVHVTRSDGKSSLEPHFKAFFWRLPSFKGGVELVHTTSLPDGGGTIQRKFEPEAHERDPAHLPQLGPDLRFSYSAERGATPTGLKLRHETRFADERLPSKLETLDFPPGLAFPRFRRGTSERHIYALYGDTHRSKSALLLEELPAPGPDGSPLPIVHEFKLERRPAGPDAPPAPPRR